MTPANPDNNKPFIYRIADARGITHLVVAVQHSHLMSEIEGLVSALAGKMDAKTIDSVPANNAYNLVSSKGVYDALKAINNLSSITSYGSAIVHAEAGNNPIVQIALQRAGETSVDANISLANIANLKRALANPDSTPTVGSDNLVTSGGVKAALDGKQNTLTFDTTPTTGSTNPVASGGVKAAIDALLTNYIPIHQVTAILPKTTGLGSEQELQSWLGDGKMALVLQTARPVEVSIEATGSDDAPDGTWSGSTDFSFDLAQGIRTVKNIYDLMYEQLQNDYPGERIGTIENWKISVYAKNTVPADTVCLINFYNPTTNE